jgi:heat shock transcription factor, other eukaryote
MAAADVANFVAKLYEIISDTANAGYIEWSPEGESFYIYDPDVFADTVLLKYFKHRNWSSFVRQLNKYDFYKCKGTDDKAEPDAATEYRNRHFQRDRPELLARIRRKKAPYETSQPSTDPYIRIMETQMLYQTSVLSTVKILAKYFSVMAEDINEIKRVVHGEQARRREKGAVLILDDDSEISLGLYHLIKKQGYRITFLEVNENMDGVLKRSKPDAIFLCSSTGRKRGIIAASRSHHPDVPLILVSSQLALDDHIDCIELGATECLIEPISPEMLLQVVEKYANAR